MKHSPTTDAAAREAYDVAGFCEAMGISRPFYYRLAADGRGPRSFKLGRRRLISREAAHEWLREQEREYNSGA